MTRQYTKRPRYTTPNDEDERAGVVLGVASLALGLLIPSVLPLPMSLGVWLLLAIDRFVAWGIEESTEPNVFQWSAAGKSVTLAPIYLPFWLGGLYFGMTLRNLAVWAWSR